MEKQKVIYRSFTMLFALAFVFCAFAFAGCSFFGLADKSTDEKIEITQNYLKASEGVTMQDEGGSSSYNDAGVISSMLIVSNIAKTYVKEDKSIEISEQKMSAMGYPAGSSAKYLISKVNGNIRIKMIAEINGARSYIIQEMKFDSNNLTGIYLQIAGSENYKYDLSVKDNKIFAKKMTDEEAQNHVSSVSIINGIIDVVINA